MTKLLRIGMAFRAACLLGIAIGQLAQADIVEKVNIVQTPSGIRFGVLGTKGSFPAPTLFLFATNIEDSLVSQTYNKVGSIVEQHGYVCVSMDLPLHRGAGSPALPPGNPGGLPGWAVAIGNGDAVVPEFVSKVSQVLDYLIQEGYTDPEKVAVAGTSRGGFIAMHVAAADTRIRCAIGFAPVTDLTELTEFADLKENTLAKSLSLSNVAAKLSGRPIWVCIGNNDERVNTDRAIEFTRKVVAASVARKKPTSTELIDVELHVMPWLGHGGNLLSSAHDIAAAWLLARMGEGNTEKG